MSLLELKAYLREIKVANLAQIVMHFQSEPEIIRQMLTHWERKGCLQKEMKTERCGSSCQKCSPLLREIYQWVS